LGRGDETGLPFLCRGLKGKVDDKEGKGTDVRRERCYGKNVMAQFTGHRFLIGGFVVLKLFAC
jgi:hypothetical protein